jgi:hypothetical protein
VLTQACVRVDEDDALLLEVLTDLVVDDLGLVLRGHPADQTLLLGLGDAQAVVGVPDVLGQVLPGGGLLLGGLHEVLDVLEVDAGQVGAPAGHGLPAEELQALQAQVEHPLGLVLAGRDVANDLVAETATSRHAGSIAVGPAVLVGPEALQTRVELFDGAHCSGPSIRGGRS